MFVYRLYLQVTELPLLSLYLFHVAASILEILDPCTKANVV